MVIKKCVNCGKEFDAKRNAKYCSDICREKRSINSKEYKKQWYQRNKERISKKKKEYAQKNKEKIKEYQKQYRQNNKEKLQQYRKQYYIDNKEHIININKQWYENNKEHLSKTKKKYYQNNRERILEDRKEYAQKNKEKIQQYQKQRYKQAYKDLSKKSNISIKDLKSYLPPHFVERELECWEQGSYFLDFITPVTNRTNGKCEITGKKTNNLFVHHLNGYNWCIEGRMDFNNVVVICRELHDAFHKKYGYGNNTAKQFWEFVEEWKKGVVTLDDFKED